MLLLFGLKFFGGNWTTSKAEDTMVNGRRRAAFEELLAVVADLCMKHRLRRKVRLARPMWSKPTEHFF